MMGWPRDATSWDAWEVKLGETTQLELALFFDCPESIRRKRLMEAMPNAGQAGDRIEHYACEVCWHL